MGLPGPVFRSQLCCLHRLEREDDVEHLLPVPGLLKIGAVWAEASGGKCLFCMPTGRKFDLIEKTINS